MFIARMNYHSLSKPIDVIDRYNHKTIKYQSAGNTLIYLVFQDRTMENHNDLKTYETTVVGYTYDASIEKDDLVDDLYKVQSIMQQKNSLRILYLKAVENGR